MRALPLPLIITNVAGEQEVGCQAQGGRSHAQTHSEALQLLLVTAVPAAWLRNVAESSPPHPTNGVRRGSCSYALLCTPLPRSLRPHLPPSLAAGSRGPFVWKPKQFQENQTDILAVEYTVLCAETDGSRYHISELSDASRSVSCRWRRDVFVPSF